MLFEKRLHCASRRARERRCRVVVEINHARLELVFNVRPSLAFGDDPHLLLLVINQRIWRHALHEENVAANRAPRAHGGSTAEDGGVGINRYLIFDIGMPFPTLFDVAVFVLLKTPRAQSYAVKKLHAVPDHARLTDHHSGPVIDKEMRTDLRPRMNINPGAAMRPFRHHSRDKWKLLLVKNMSEALDGDGFE